MVDVLLGGSTEKISQLGHALLSVYGTGRELDRGQWSALVRQLVGLGVLLTSEDARGGLCFGPDALVRPLLRGERELALARWQHRRPGLGPGRPGGGCRPAPQPEDLAAGAGP